MYFTRGNAAHPRRLSDPVELLADEILPATILTCRTCLNLVKFFRSITRKKVIHRRALFIHISEYWNIGVMEYWIIGWRL